MAKLLIPLCTVTGFAINVKQSRPVSQDLLTTDQATLAAETRINDVKAMMEKAPKDFHAQVDGCWSLNTLSQDGRQFEALGPYGGRRVADKWLKAGLYEVMAQGLLNILAVPQNQESEDELFAAASACVNTLIQSTVQNDAGKANLMHWNSPHVWDAMVGYFERFKTSKAEQVLGSNLPLAYLAALYGNWNGDENDSLGLIAEGLDRAGGFKLILDVLEHNYTNPAVFLGACGALSDHLVGSRAVPRIIADHYDGIRLITNAVRHAQSAKPYHEENGYGLRYEVLEDVTGFLRNDDNGRFAKSFLDEGLLDEVIKLMPREPNDLYFQDHCCQVFNWLTNSNPVVQHKFAHSAGAELVKKAATEPCAPNCTWPPIVRGVTDSDLSPSCKFLNQNLEQLLQGRAQWKDWSMREFQP